MDLTNTDQADELPVCVPESTKAVWTVLEHGPLTGKQLKEATGLPRRTIYTAIRRLRELGLICERQSLKDTRQTYFWRKHASHSPA